MADGDIAMESSQGESLERASTHLNVLQAALGEITAEATRLKSLCKTYRAQRTELEATLATLKADVSRMGDEKEEARLDLVAEKEALTWWALREKKEGAGGASGGASGHTTPTPGAIRDLRSKAETAGRAIRRAHFFEGQVKEAEVRYQALEKKKEDAVQEEMAVSAGLRDRIGRLEGKLRVAEQGKADAVALAEREKKEREERSMLWQDKEARWQSEKEDLLQLRDELRGRLRAAEEKIVQVQRERQAPAVEGQKAKIPGAFAEGTAASISRPLTPLQTNRPIPTTPSRSNRSPPRSSIPSTPSSLAKRLAYMEDRHRILQVEYDKIRAQHESDLRSWREWKKAHLARQDEKKAKRAKRRAERISHGDEADVRSATEELGDLGPTQAPDTAFGAATQVRPPVAVVVEASQESPDQDLDQGGGGQADEGAVSIDCDAQRVKAERGIDTVRGGQEANRFLDVHPPAEAPDISDLTELPEWVSPMDPTHSQRVRTDHKIQHEHDHHRKNERDSPEFDGQRQQPVATATIPQLHQIVNHSPDRDQSYRSDQRPRTAPRLAPKASFAAQRHRLTSPTKARGTPQHNTPASVHHATRTTPWLGKAPLGRTGSASAQARTLQTMDDDIFASPPDADTSRNDPPIPTFSTTTPAKLLVRDRTGRTAMPGGAAPNSLLRTALQGRKADHDAVGPSEDQVTPSRSAGSSSRMGHTPLRRTESGGSTSRLSGKIDVPRTPGQAGTGTGAKRKINQVDLAELDFAEMTPHEKQLYRKRLAQLPEQERREVYKGYKGKGRYLPPEQLQKGIADEYEIDPKLNEGHTHQYHDVKRKRSERRKMHGGDCECCRDYYEAVGHIPRYNQGPKWNDGTTGPAGERSAGGDAVHEHQQLVSRHRETWAVGGTPPGYWSIGFPTSQDAAEQNRRAAEMTREKEARIRQDAELGTGKYRRKADA